MVHYNVYKSSLHFPVLRQNPIHNLPLFFHEIHFNIILPSTHRSSEWSSSFKRPNKSFERISQLHPCYKTAHHIHLDWIILTISGEKYKLWNSTSMYQDSGNGNFSVHGTTIPKTLLGFTDSLLSSCSRIIPLVRHAWLNSNFFASVLRPSEQDSGQFLNFFSSHSDFTLHSVIIKTDTSM